MRNFHSRRNDNFLRYFFVNGLDVIVAAIVVENADHGRMGAGDGAQDAALGAAIRPERHYFDEHAVTVHGRAGGGRRNKNIASKAGFKIWIERSGVRNYEAVTVAMHAEAPDQHVAPRLCLRLRDRIVCSIDLTQLPLFYESVQAVGQFAACIAPRSQIMQQLLVARHFFGLARDVAENGGIGEHWLISVIW